MSFFDLDRWNEIWETITRNRRRSIMTALGVFWGIFMLVVLLGGGMGLSSMVRSQLGGMSTNTAYVDPRRTSIPYNGMPKGRWWRFNIDDIESVRSKVKGVRYISAMHWGGTWTYSHGQLKGEYFTMGYMPEYDEILPQNILMGRFINEIDMQTKRKVCLIGVQVWRELFPGGENPLGKKILMNGISMTVVGVLDKWNANINFGGPPEQTVIVPISLIQQLFGEGNTIDAMVFSAYDGLDMKEVQAEVKKVIAANHIISPEDTKAFGGFDLSEQYERVNGLFSGVTLLTWIVGLGTLLAGIVGVSNIMLVIVRERTQEIGVRRAIGAKPVSIISQILSESFILTFIAGILGLSLAVAVLSLVDGILARLPETPIESVQISFGMGLLAAGIIILGSILAGLIPANRALQIKAVDAIREE